MDKLKAEQAVRMLLEALDQDVNREGLKDTPRRVAKMFMEQCTANGDNLDTTFHIERFDELVLVRNVPFASFCEHHLVPFAGLAHVGYLPDLESKTSKVLGLSKLARLVYACSKGFTIQEKIAMDIADHLEKLTAIKGCMVVIEAAHGCMNLRGAKAIGSSTVTSVCRGAFRDSPAARAEFLALIHNKES